MKAKGRFISTLIVINAFFMGYAYGLNSRHVLAVDPSLPPLALKPAKAEPDSTKKNKDESKKAPEAATDKKPMAKEKDRGGHKTTAEKHGSRKEVTKKEAAKNESPKKEKSGSSKGSKADTHHSTAKEDSSK